MKTFTLLYFFSNILMLFAQNIQYPVPKTKNMLFYIQRNHNENAIVYDAKFDNNGQLDTDKPIDAYWIRFQEQGQRMELRSFEKWMAYGVSCKKSDNPDYDYRVYLSASKKLTLWLKQTAPFKAEIIAEVKDKKMILKHMYATADESGWIPKILYGEFFGLDRQTGEKVYVKVLPEDMK